jgi:hypothetical protein
MAVIGHVLSGNENADGSGKMKGNYETDEFGGVCGRRAGWARVLREPAKEPFGGSGGTGG